MKFTKILPIISLLFLASCATIKVEADYDTTADFSQYKTFAFYKKGIEKVDISSLDKKRIIKAIEQEMLAKGFTLSSKPDIVVNIFAKSTKKVTVHNNTYSNYYWQPYYYYGPYYGMNYGTHVSQYDEGTLFIDFIIVMTSMPVVRKIMTYSTLFDASAPQWIASKYWQSGAFIAVVYLLLALTSGFYSLNKIVEKAKIPIVNFWIFSFLIFLGFLACWRYSVIFPDMQFISKKALLFSMVISYFSTTLVHYLIASYFNKEKL